MSSIERMAERSRGERMVDLSLNAIELIDRNLYERTCDVRWWATDSAVVDCAATPKPRRLQMSLGAARGDPRRLHRLSRSLALRPRGQGDRQRPRRPLSRRRPGRRPTKWFREARDLRSGDDYVAGDVEMPAAARQTRRSRPIAPACAPSGKANGKPIGVLAIHFDWEPQARAIVQGVRVGASDKARVLLVDSNFRVIAASDGQGLLSERVQLSMKGGRSGFYQERDGRAGRVSCHARLRDLQGARLVRRHPRRRGVAGAGKASSPSGRRSRQNPWRRCPSRPWPRNRISATGRIRSAARRRILRGLPPLYGPRPRHARKYLSRSITTESIANVALLPRTNRTSPYILRCQPGRLERQSGSKIPPPSTPRLRRGLTEAPPKSLIEIGDFIEAAGERNVADLHPVPLLAREQSHRVLESSFKKSLGKAQTGILQQVLDISGRDPHASRDMLD